jgi:hypothetical protein
MEWPVAPNFFPYSLNPVKERASASALNCVNIEFYWWGKVSQFQP